MANTSKRIQVSELDFDQIKSNLKNFLKGQSQFSDYDFEGSSLSVLLDILAYNTHYNALYTNLAINEMFLDSASKRASVVSLAKQLGYTPNSARASRAVVSARIVSPSSTPTVVTIPQFSPFNTSVNGKSYTFYNRDEKSIVVTDGSSYVFNDVEIVEGTPLSYKYTVADGQQYIIPNQNCDTSTLTVRIQDSASSDVFTTFYPSTSITTADSTSRVYFMKEIDNGLFEITFGDGVLGKALENGNVVHLNYFVTNGENANGARTFTYNGIDLLDSGLAVTTTTIAAGGTAAEDIDSIRYNAPRLYAAQNRAVTPTDYKALILGNFTDAASVSVWGGEDNNPPIYGKVFICVKPKLAAKLTLQQKSDILTTILNTKNVVSITPEIIDPDYINIDVNTTVYYNERETTKTKSQIESSVMGTILSYNDSDLQKFDGVLRYSKLMRLIDETEQSIANNITTLKLRRAIAPRYNVSAEYSINLVNPIYTSGEPEESIESTGFYIYGDTENKVHYLTDSGDGFIQLYYKATTTSITTGTQTTTKVIVNPKIGTVDYANGYINIKNLNITALADSVFEIIVKPQSNDIISAYTQVAQIDTSTITVTAIADQTINGDFRGGKNYQFTSSRS